MADLIFMAFAIVMLIFKPMLIANFLGGVYWRSGKFTAIGKSEETKKYFYSQNPFWFRILGFLLAGLTVSIAVAR